MFFTNGINKYRLFISNFCILTIQAVEKFFQGQSSQEQEEDGEFPSILKRLFLQLKCTHFIGVIV